MKNFYRIACVSLLIVAVGCAGIVESDSFVSGDSGSWQSLSDLSQWRTYGQPDADPRWRIENGTIVLTARGGGDLITKAEFADFELWLEWQIGEGGNSGIFFLADESKLPIFVHAPEIQILDNERHADGQQANRRSGSLYDMVAAPAASQLPAGSWNTARILYIAGHLRVWQNDVLAVDIHIGSPLWNSLLAGSKFADWNGFGANTSGHIGLQDHGDRVAFKNIRIQRL